MAVTTSGVVLLDPTLDPAPRPTQSAPRLATLEGKTIGFLDNTKPNADRFLHHLEELLRERHGLANAVHVKKAASGRVATAELLDELARTCNAVVPAVGD